eukprot:3690735-Pyramimonas_sp.AAC.2
MDAATRRRRTGGGGKKGEGEEGEDDEGCEDEGAHDGPRGILVIHVLVLLASTSLSPSTPSI